MLSDIRHSLRALKTSRGFFLTAVLVLAFGLTGVSLIFNVVNTVILRKLPYPKPDRIMTVTETIPGFSSGPTVCTPSEYLRWRRSGLFHYMTAIESADHKLTGQGHPELITGANVTPDFFKTFGIRPILGRDFRSADASPGHNHVIILSHQLWARRFASDEKIVGKTIRLDDSFWTVIGVAAPRFDFPRLSDLANVMNWAPEQSEFWTPLTITQKMVDNGNINYYVLGRLRDGVSPDQARVQCRTIASESFRELAKQYPAQSVAIEQVAAHLTVQVTPLRNSISGSVRGVLWMLLGAVGLLLTLVLFNLGNLLLTRGTNRLREYSLRQALGASRWQIFRQSLIEQGIVVFSASLLTLVLTGWGLHLIRTFAASRVPRLYGLSLDVYGIAFLAGVAFATAVLFSSFPLFITPSSNLNALLQREGRSATGDRRTNRLRSAFLVAEIAISVVLLTGAGFLMESLAKVLQVNPGFAAHHLLTMSVSLNPKAFKSQEQTLAAVKRILDELRRIPGVVSASTVNGLPLSGEHELHGVQALGTSKANFGNWQSVEYRVVNADYFRTMGIPVIQGRTFRQEEGNTLAVINKEMAGRFWPGEDPIGKQFREDDKSLYTVIGVVGNVRSGTLEQNQTMQFYRPLAANPGYANTFVMRTSVDPNAVALQARKAVWRADAEDAVTHCRPMEEIVQAATLPRKVETGLSTGFAVSALLLAALGLFSVVSLSVIRRTREFGIRLALGATAADIAWLELSRALVLLFAGTALGFTLSIFTVKSIQPLLFNVTTSNPEVYAVALLVLFAAALSAAWLPTRRAARIDPASALRED